MGWDNHILEFVVTNVDKDEAKKIKKTCSIVSQCSFKKNKEYVGEGFCYLKEHDINWYGYDSDFLTISKNNPNALIKVNTSIDYDGRSIHVLYYKNGQKVDASPVLVYPKFDEKEFKIIE